jgi:putative N6-adenine-specific DNA methylase
MERFPETGADYTVKVSMMKNKALITVDTSGTALHKRGYRQKAVPAPLKETMAAALIEMSFWKEDRILLDPCCGSGTIAIEAAMIGKNIAPGLGRSFASEKWEFIESGLWKEERKNAYEQIRDVPLKIYASDVDPRSMAAARENAADAGVDLDISFKQINITDVKAPGENGIIIVNPPYGRRIGEEKAIRTIYDSLRRFHEDNPDWSLFMITADKAAEKQVWGREADRRRKLYNGNVETCYYQFHGIKNRE